MKKKGIAVLGSTGSIGTQTLQIVAAFPEKFEVISMAAGRNLQRLREQIGQFKPRRVSVNSEIDAETLRKEFPDVDILSGEEGCLAAIRSPGVEVVVVGIVGFAGLAPALEAIRQKKTVALANKEALVVAGTLIREEARKHQALVIPVDSEHNALYQLLEGRDVSQVASVVLTASGGPLLKMPELPLEDVTPQLAVKHPNWSMGPKISVDSATLMNKGLEVIEAHFLFDFPEPQIEVWVHPQSLIHGALWLKDNSCLAQLSKPDMRSSIGYAMAYPQRLPEVIPKLTFEQMAKMEFYPPDLNRFPALRLAREALRAGPSYLVALNAANEIAVENFLSGKILFPEIPRQIEKALERHRPEPVTSLDVVFRLDQEARR